MGNRNCGRCRFRYDPSEGLKEEPWDECGVCHRYPPMLFDKWNGDERVTGHPIVYLDDWCGEFAQEFVSPGNIRFIKKEGESE